MEVVALVPGATAANTNISLPAYAKKMSQLVAAVKSTQADISHAACGATGAAYASATALGHPVNVLTALTVTSGTPAAGQIQQVDESTVQCGDALEDGDVLILIYLPKGEISGF